jgi:hypothetical protein
MDEFLLKYRQLGDMFDTFAMGVMVVGPESPGTTNPICAVNTATKYCLILFAAANASI